MSNGQDWVGGGKENLRRGRAGKVTAAHKEEGSDGEMSFGAGNSKLGRPLHNSCGLLDESSPSACQADISQCLETCLNRQEVFIMGLIWECSGRKGSAPGADLQSIY